jgi:PAS domain S-box-containing protein
MLSHWFLTGNELLALCTPYRHDPWFVVVSYLVATFAAYTAFDLIARVRAAGSRSTRLLWLMTAGLSMGFGIWAMHFIAMLAVEIPIPVRFDLPLTALSAGFAALASAVAFHIVADASRNRVRLGLAGIVLGSGIGLMHYTGMAALRMSAHIYYDPRLFALSVVVAVVLSTVALFVLSALPKFSDGRLVLARLMGSALMGLAIVLMHYTGMFATYFYPEAGGPESGVLFDPSIMATAIAAVSLLIVGLALSAALFDRRAERAEIFLRDAVNSISEGFVIFDREDRFVMCNEAYRQIYPGSANLLVPGTRFEEIVRDKFGQGVYADARESEDEWLIEQLRNHREAKCAVEQKLSNGSWVLVTDRRMANGGIAGLRIDISALKATQAELHDSKQRLDRAQEMMGIGSWEFDVVTERAVWSKEMYRIRGMAPERDEMITHAPSDTIHNEDFSKVYNWLARLRLGLAPGPIEYRIQRTDGKIRIVTAEGQRVADQTGTVTKIAGTERDITERRLTEQQLIQAQKMQTVGQLTGGLAHDFNNILGAVIGNLDLVAERVEPGSEVAGYCSVALDAALSAAELVKRLLAFSRRQALHPRPTNLDDAIANVLPLVKRTLGEQIRIETELASQLWPAVADPVQLESAILNLTVNARDAMPKGGTLKIQATNARIEEAIATASGDLQPGEYVTIAVSDTGGGMSPDVLARAFEPFFTTKPPGAGSGLGLSMVFGTMQQLGGAVHIDSEVGTGTTVRLYLPRADGQQGADRDLEGSPKSSPTGREHILLVEDNDQIRTLGTGILRSLGYQVTVATSGDDAIEYVESGARFDLLFTDIVMPGRVDGLALATELRARDPKARILFTSGFSSPVTLRSQIDIFNAELISKPYRKTDLAVLVHKILNRIPETAA